MSLIMTFIIIFLVLGTDSGLHSIAYAEDKIATSTDAEGSGDTSGNGQSDMGLCDEETGNNETLKEDNSDINELTANAGNYKGENYEVKFNIDNKWENGFNATVIIANTGDTPIENWCISFPLEQKISNIWNGIIDETYEDFYVVKNEGWNQDIPVGGSVSFGMTCYEAFTEYPEYYTLIGNEVELKNGDYTVSYEITEDWGDGYKALITITNNKSVPIEDWRIKFEYSDNVITKIWDAKILSESEGKYQIRCEDYNQNITAGKSVTFGILVEPGSSETEIKNVVVSEYGVTQNTGVNVDTEGKYVILAGYLNDVEDTAKLELYMESTEECSRYEIYAAIDGAEEVLVGTVEGENEYTYPLTDDFKKLKIYARGYFGDNSYLDSAAVYVETSDETYIVMMQDTDDDGLDDCYELYYESDIYETDTDGDGLDDCYEVNVSGTSPARADTDDNGIKDCDEDYDEDGLTISQERNLETEVWDSDTDWDGLSDGEEINTYDTDPLVADTDRDELSDGDEIILGTDPLTPDTDGDGILDGDERVEQTYTHAVENEACVVTEVSVTLEGTGCLQTNTHIESIMDKHVLCSNVVGLIGEPFEIETESEFEQATLTFKIDKTKLEDVLFENLMFLWYDEENNQFVELDTIHDEQAGCVSVETTHFSKYVLVNRDDWFGAWKFDFNYATMFADSYTAYIIDCSSDMEELDPIKTKRYFDYRYGIERIERNCYRTEAVSRFIDNAPDTEMISIYFSTNGRNGCIKFTNDRIALKDYLVYCILSTAGPSYSWAMDNLIESVEKINLLNMNAAKKAVIIAGNDNPRDLSEVAEDCISNGIVVDVIYIGGDGEAPFLKALCNETGGIFYRINAVDELSKLYDEISTSGNFDRTDSDGDGLYDIVEESGMRLQDGRIIYTKVGDDDSDDDGLLDGEEINPKPVYCVRYDNGEKISGYCFKMYSDPNNPDTDGDGALDSEDATLLEYNKFKSYIFYAYNAESFIKHEAKTRYKELTNVYNKDVEMDSTTTIATFKTLWDSMGLDDNKKIAYIIDEVHIIYHGAPRSIAISRNNGWLYADGSQDNTSGNNVYSKANGDMLISDLETKKINYLNLSCCNNGNLDYIASFGVQGYEDNIAISFLNSKHSIGKVTAWDGYSEYDKVYLAGHVFGYEHSSGGRNFDVWSYAVNGCRREAEQQITYWRDANGNIVWSPNQKHLKYY